MRKVEGYSLWLGHVGDVRELRAVLKVGICAIVDLALEEPPAELTRELIYIRCPLHDGAGNAPWMLRFAVESVAKLIREDVPTLVYCSAGMSRTPAIAAAAIASVGMTSFTSAIEQVTKGAASDLSPILIDELQVILD